MRDQLFWNVLADVLADVDEEFSAVSLVKRQKIERNLASAIITAMLAGVNDPHLLRRYGEYLAHRKLKRLKEPKRGAVPT